MSFFTIKNNKKIKLDSSNRNPKAAMGRKTMPNICEWSSCVSMVRLGGKGPLNDIKSKSSQHGLAYNGKS